jgi:hypothetical protein
MHGTRVESSRGNTVGQDLSRLARLYRADGFVHLPGLISPGRAAQLQLTTEDVPVRQVICGDEGVRFGEQTFDDGHSIPRFFAADEQTRLVLALAGSQEVRGVRCWTAVYRRGQFIEQHTDEGGSIQLLVCLHAPRADTHGGHLVLRRETREQVAFALSPGDAVAFTATAVPHRTTPLVGSSDDPDPLRIVGIGRYYTQ